MNVTFAKTTVKSATSGGSWRLGSDAPGGATPVSVAWNASSSDVYNAVRSVLSGSGIYSYWVNRIDSTE